MMQRRFLRYRAALAVAVAVSLAFALGGTSMAQSPSPAVAPSPAASPIDVSAYDGTWSGTSVSEGAQGACAEYSASVTMQGGKGTGDGSTTAAGVGHRVYNYRTSGTLSPSGKFELRFVTDDPRISLQNRTAYFSGRPVGDTFALTQHGANTCRRTMTLKRQ